MNQKLERICYDIALAECDPEIIDNKQIVEKWNLRPESINRIKSDPNAQQQITLFKDLIQEEGVPFRMRAQMFAQEWLPTLNQLMHDPDASANAKADIFKQVTELAGYRTKENIQGTTAGSGSGINIQINFSKEPQTIQANQPQPVIEGETMG